MKFIFFIIWTYAYLTVVSSRKHQLVLENDIREYFSITTFGFSAGGTLEVHLNDLTLLSKYNGIFGFSLARTENDNIIPYMESHQNKCLLFSDDEKEGGNSEILSFSLNTKTNEVDIKCSKFAENLEILQVVESNQTSPGEDMRKSQIVIPKLQGVPNQIVKQKRAVEPSNAEDTVSDKTDSVKTSTNKPDAGTATTVSTTAASVSCNPPKLTFKNAILNSKRIISDLKFMIVIKNEKAAGLYSLFFHNCAGYKESAVPINLSISIVEKNGDSYLSRGEIALPKLYFFMCVVFFITGWIWIYFIRMKKEEAFKIHYLMALLIYVKSLSLLFHGINFHIISKEGFPMEAWAVLYYVTHLLKGALLFITIVLIGTGWAFIKHILSDKDKKIFMIVIPLQVLANVAKIIMEESEEGDSQHYYWREIFILVDLMCCGAILFPVVWSIRHLQDASQTDGKAAINLEKLKLFRYFYVMIVCYIYFTRIIVYLLKITVPYEIEWLDEAFREIATLFFFVLTGYNFRPTTANPYFRVSQDEDVEMEEVVTETRFTESLTKTVRSREAASHGEDSGPTKRESSHEYD